MQGQHEENARGEVGVGWGALWKTGVWQEQPAVRAPGCSQLSLTPIAHYYPLTSGRFRSQHTHTTDPRTHASLFSNFSDSQPSCLLSNPPIHHPPGFFTGTKKESMFKVPEGGKVGVIGSGRGMTEAAKRGRHEFSLE